MISGFAGEHFILFYFKKFLLLGKTPLIRTFYNSNFFLGPLAIRIIEVRLYGTCLDTHVRIKINISKI